MLVSRVERKERCMPDEELRRSADILAERFVQRWDHYAIQLEDGRYVCNHRALNTGHIYSHLRGEITLGIYVLNKDSQTRFTAVDADSEKTWKQLIALAKSLSSEKIPAYLENSRRGGHLWFFFSRPIAGKSARYFANNILHTHQIKDVEVFPKQDEIGNGLGSLIRLPFGVHRRTGRRYGFYGSDYKPLAISLREQIYALQRPEFVSRRGIDAHTTHIANMIPEVAPEQLQDSSGLISEKIKAHISVLEFVSQYVDMRTTSTGAIGHCPFHDDENPSFGINDQENYWHCFAGCGGGSVIDFWSKWREKQDLDSSFKSTITELAQILF